jgi:hypothetical protein
MKFRSLWMAVLLGGLRPPIWRPQVVIGLQIQYTCSHPLLRVSGLAVYLLTIATPSAAISLAVHRLRRRWPPTGHRARRTRVGPRGYFIHSLSPLNLLHSGWVKIEKRYQFSFTFVKVQYSYVQTHEALGGSHTR